MYLMQLIVMVKWKLVEQVKHPFKVTWCIMPDPHVSVADPGVVPGVPGHHPRLQG